MKTLIAVPAMSSVPTRFVRSLVGLYRPPDTYTSISESTLIHDARNEFASLAITKGFDQVLWLDSDMVFDSNLLMLLSDHIRSGKQMVCGLFFKRVLPTVPVIYSDLPMGDDGFIRPVIYSDYPHNSTFEVAACGFGAVMTTTDLLRRVWDEYGPPFGYHVPGTKDNIGEDMAFCWRVHQLGVPMYCDSTIRVGHVGTLEFTEDVYISQTQRLKQQTNTSDPESGDTHV